MIELVLGFLIIILLIGYGILSLIWFFLSEIAGFIGDAHRELTKPSPEKKLENAAEIGRQDIHSVTNTYRHQVQEILKDR